VHPLAAEKSNYEIAEHCGVAEKTIRNHKDSIYGNSVDTKTRTVTRKGKTYTQKTANIGKKKVTPEALPM
jgi:DNA-binding NarL/FixJ family response regulator